MSRNSGQQSGGGQPLSIKSLLTTILIIIIAAIYYVNNPPSSDNVAAEPTATPYLSGPTFTPAQVNLPNSAQATATAQAAIAQGGATWYEAFFTRPIYPDKPANRSDAPILDRFVQYLNSAQISIDIAIYEFDIPAATQALVDARERGVKVRMVTDSDSLDGTDEAMTTAYTSLTDAGITVIGDNRSAIMHDKFVVLDNRYVWMGSWNFTEGDTFRLNNNGVLIDSIALAANYTAEFKQMFEQKDFGPSKEHGANSPKLTIGGESVRNYFAPKDDIESQLVSLVSGAQQSVYFMAFQFTQDDVGAAMAKRAQVGVAVSGVFETTGSQTAYSEYGQLLKLGLPVYQDGNPYIMHHKVIIVDEKTVAFGSYNFSDAAQKSNDENMLIVISPSLAAQFVQEFQYVRDVAINAAK